MYACVGKSKTVFFPFLQQVGLEIPDLIQWQFVFFSFTRITINRTRIIKNLNL